MVFTIATINANRLYAHAKAERLGQSKALRPQLSLIQCHIKGNIFTAQFINREGCSEFTCEVKDGEDGIFWLAPPPKKFNPKKESFYITIEDCHESTTYITAQGKQTIMKPNYAEDEFKLQSFWSKEPQATVYMNPKVLMSALSAYVDNATKLPVKIEFLGEKTGLYISGKFDEKTFVLPVNVKNGW